MPISKKDAVSKEYSVATPPAINPATRSIIASPPAKHHGKTVQLVAKSDTVSTITDADLEALRRTNAQYRFYRDNPDDLDEVAHTLKFFRKEWVRNFVAEKGRDPAYFHLPRNVHGQAQVHGLYQWARSDILRVRRSQVTEVSPKRPALAEQVWQAYNPAFSPDDLPSNSDHLY